MIARELEAKILRLYYAEKWKIGTLSLQLGVHHSTVRRVLAQAGVEEARRPQRASMISPFLPFIEATLEQYPTLTASRLYQMVQERGYPGSPHHFRHMVSRLRKKPKAESYLRLRTLPGEQAQVDWGHFGKLRVGRAERSLMAFVMVLSWSRAIYLHFFLDARLSSFLHGHELAFAAFSGVSRVCLYDNLKSVVLEREGDVIRFQPQFLDFATHYRFEPRPVAPARGNEKGRVERAIRYIRESFFAARSFRDLAHLNQQAQTWCQTIPGKRPWPDDRRLTVKEALRDEQSHLLPLPHNPFPCEERLEVAVHKTPYVRYDLNDYSVPHDRTRRTLVVYASQEQVRITDGREVVAVHPRCYSKGERLEDPSHLEALAKEKRAARQHRSTDRVLQAVPSAKSLLASMAERGLPLRPVLLKLCEWLELFGAQSLESAVEEALRLGSPHPNTVARILEQRHRGAEPKVSLRLPDDPKVREATVKPHALTLYDQGLSTEEDGDA